MHPHHELTSSLERADAGLLGGAGVRADAGRAARQSVPRSSHAEWTPPADRVSPLTVIGAQEEGRLGWLLPVRHARMAASPFGFYRAGAAIMAADLAGTPDIGASVQLCGDAHLGNFGAFATAERRRAFDVSDFDETLPGPWEWDIKRLAVSFVLASRRRSRAAAVRVVRSYRVAMLGFATMSTLEVWEAQARRRIGRRALGNVTETVDGQLRLRSAPPLLVPLRELSPADRGDELWDSAEANLASYLEGSAHDRRHLLSRYRLADVAVKAVGVSSVGTRCFLVLLVGRDHGEPLFLQVKQAGRSVLEPYLSPSEFDHQGQRVVEGQRFMQATSDRFLGWSSASSGLEYYWRTYRDVSGAADVAHMNGAELLRHADLCGWALAHAHARTGDPITIAAYLGASDSFDTAVGAFAVAYARQVEADHTDFLYAIKDGRFPV
jgi:uncharacterized protein (DUF2252 family)